MPLLEDFEGDVIVTNGDVPLVPPNCYVNLVTARRKRDYAALISSIVLDKPASYGRIKRDGLGDVEGIVEFRDANDDEILIREVNSGTYCFNAADLRESIDKIKNHNAQGEYYLTGMTHEHFKEIIFLGSEHDYAVFTRSLTGGSIQRKVAKCEDGLSRRPGRYEQNRP